MKTILWTIMGCLSMGFSFCKTEDTFKQNEKPVSITQYKSKKDSFLEVGNFKCNQQLYAESIKYYDSAFSIKKGDIPQYYYNSYAFAKREMGDYEGAILICALALKKDSTNYESLYDKADIESDLKEYEQSIIDFTTLIKRNPTYPQSYSGRGYAEMKLGQIELATDDYDKAAIIEGDGHYQRAKFRIYIKDYHNAILDLNIEIDQVKKIATKRGVQEFNSDAYTQRGYSKSQINDIEGACIDLHKALQLGDENAQGYIDILCK